MAIFSGSTANKAQTAAQIINQGSKKISNILEGKKSVGVADLFDELSFQDDHASDYRVYFNSANFEIEDDNVPIQFIYLGYGNNKKSIRTSIGFINGDRLSLEYGALIDLSEGIEWIKGGEFVPPITAITDSQSGDQLSSKITILDEGAFLKTALDYVRKFEQVAVVELNEERENAARKVGHSGG